MKQLIAEEASSTAERRELEELAGRLEEILRADVPYRPEFKAQLRRRLVAQARQQLTPWYRRPAFLGSGMAVAAAAAVLFFGLHMFRQPLEQHRAPTAQVPESTTPPPVEPRAQGPGITSLVQVPTDVRVVAMADEAQSAALPRPNFAANDASQGLQLKRLSAHPDEGQFRALATRLAFRGESRRTPEGWSLTEGSRSLSLGLDGQVNYTDTAPAGNGPAIDAERAKQEAYRFLDKAALPVPGQPVVTSENHLFTVTYTEQVEGRPVVNARTVVQISDQGAVLKAQAYVPSGTETHGTYPAIPESEALAQAKSRGGSFDRADLVWVRTPGEGVVYLQPYWRVFGTDSSNQPVVRYVPALKR
jgi:hypothetical protein